MTALYNCLVVDDDPMFIIVAESVLGTITEGKIVTAFSGREGLERLGGGNFDFVFLDLNMPDLDGLAFMRGAAEAGFRGKIVISSGEAKAILQAARNLGNLLGIEIAAVIYKPLKIADVEAVFTAAATAEKPASSKDAIALSDQSYDLTPYYQPQYSLRNGQLFGFEALLRLTTRDGQVHGPSRLFDALKDHEQLIDVSLRIAERVVRDLARWQLDGQEPRVSINFDASVLERPEVVSTVQKLFREHAINPKRICLEVTERSLPNNLSMLVEAVARLRMAGFHLSLDDYGTGSSNFELLRLCPFSELKLDRSIVTAAVDDVVSKRFFHSACQIARDLDLVTVAEGVETPAELGEVLSASADIVQGFLFSKPVPAAEALTFMTANDRVPVQQQIAFPA